MQKIWKSSYEYVMEAFDRAEKCEKRILSKTPGGRKQAALIYGGKSEARGSANYSSACGAMDKGKYHNKHKTPVIMLIGAVHGQETEGVAALTNLISLMETGKDLAGFENESLLALARRVRLVIVPIANPDGRARVIPETMIGLTGKDLRYWGQGTWADGSLCGWPECKMVHPIRNVSFLGGYFNDDGVNIMHDNFFSPMAEETKALLSLADDVQADGIFQLHGGSNSANALLQPRYTPVEVNEAIRKIAENADARAREEGLRFQIPDLPPKPSGDTPPSFNLVDALHHVSGAVSACFESNEGLIDENEPIWNTDQVLRSHEILFEEIFRYFLA